MALVPTCDRCPASNVPLERVLGKDLCLLCVNDVQGFIAMPPIARTNLKPQDRVRAALRVCEARGAVTDAEIAALNGEARRTAYFRLMGLARAGKLVHVGHGRFVMPEEKAAG